jgi:hypothetical protein
MKACARSHLPIPFPFSSLSTASLAILNAGIGYFGNFSLKSSGIS